MAYHFGKTTQHVNSAAPSNLIDLQQRISKLARLCRALRILRNATLTIQLLTASKFLDNGKSSAGRKAAAKFPP